MQLKETRSINNNTTKILIFVGEFIGISVFIISVIYLPWIIQYLSKYIGG
jgi:hypothetical protein